VRFTGTIQKQRLTFIVIIHDIYSYYPYNSSVGSTTEYPFSVYSDQSISGNYYNSDFLWAKASSVTAQTDPVNIYFGHRMSKIVISTTAGAGFTESEFNAAIQCCFKECSNTWD